MIPNRALCDDLSMELQAYSDQLGEIKKEHTRFIDLLLRFNHHEEFYILLDFRTRQITWSHGIKTWLGYPDAGEDAGQGPMPFDCISRHVHPFLRDWYRVYENAALLTMTDHPTETSMLAYRFVLTIPVRTAAGRYVMVKEMTMPYEYDKNNKVLTCLQSFTLISEFRPIPLRPEFFQIAQRLGGSWDERFNRYVAGCVHIYDTYALPPHLKDTFDVMLHFYENGHETKDIHVANALSSRGEHKRLHRTTGSGYMKHLKHWLIALMVREDEKQEILSFFPSDARPADVFRFYAQSGIIYFLKNSLIR